jgi:hypothetical protein
MWYVVKIWRDKCPVCGLVSDVYTHGKGEGQGGCDHSVAVFDEEGAQAFRPTHTIKLAQARKDAALEPFATYPQIPATTTPKFGVPEVVNG